MLTRSGSETSAAEPSSNMTGSDQRESESVFSRRLAHGRKAPPSEVTVASSISLTTTQLVIQAVALLPPAPTNTPATRSTAASESDKQNVGLQIDSLAHRLAPFESPVSPSASEHGGKGTGHFHEHSTWSDDVCQACGEGLQRLANLATDLNKIDRSISMGEHYSRLLGEVIRQVGVKVDLDILQKAIKGDK